MKQLLVKNDASTHGNFCKYKFEFSVSVIRNLQITLHATIQLTQAHIQQNG